MEMKETKNKYSKLLWVLLASLVIVNIIVAVLLFLRVSEKKKLNAQFSEGTTANEAQQEEIEITLPDTVYVATGITMEIYNVQVTNLGSGITKYNVCWNCEVGENLERKFSVAADETNEGSYELTLEIYDNALNLVAQKSCILNIVEADPNQKDAAKAITNLSEVPEECVRQVEICVDTAYNGAIEELKPEGLAQLQDIVFSVLSGALK